MIFHFYVIFFFLFFVSFHSTLFLRVYVNIILCGKTKIPSKKQRRNIIQSCPDIIRTTTGDFLRTITNITIKTIVHV